MMLAAFACAACVSAQAQDKKQEFVMPTGYAGITHEMSEFYEPVPPVVTPGTELKGGGFTARRMLLFCLTEKTFPNGKV